jgi:antitoxin PrlF
MGFVKELGDVASALARTPGWLTYGLAIAATAIQFKRGSRTMSTESTMTSKGQTTIPREIRDSLHMKAGDRMTFTLLPDGTVLMRVKNKSAMEIAGRLQKKRRKALPIEDLSR